MNVRKIKLPLRSFTGPSIIIWNKLRNNHGGFLDHFAVLCNEPLMTNFITNLKNKIELKFCIAKNKVSLIFMFSSIYPCFYSYAEHVWNDGHRSAPLYTFFLNLKHFYRQILMVFSVQIIVNW